MTTSAKFKAQYSRSNVYEFALAHYLENRSWFVNYQFDATGRNDDHAPMLYGPESKTLITPDLWGCKAGRAQWFEVKLKEHADYNRKYARTVTGFALRHYLDYCAIRKESGLPVHVIFVHEREQIVYTAELADLGGKYFSHIHEGTEMDRGGTVFFKFDELPRLMTLADLNKYAVQGEKTR